MRSKIFEKLTLWSAIGISLFAIALEVAAQAPLTNQAALEFDAVSIRPAQGGRGQSTRTFSDPAMLRMTLVGANMMIAFAYQREPFVPQDMLWVYNTHYDLIAKTSGPSTVDQQRIMLQKVLAERFALKCHVETKDGPVLVLVLGPKPHLEETHAEGEFGVRILPSRGFETQQIIGQRVTMAELARYMSWGGKPVIDKTGLTGRYDFSVSVDSVFYPPLDVDVPPGQRRVGLPVEVQNDAIVKHLGLKLESQRGPIETLMIDHIEKPSEN